jgi:hypothetical protein
MKPNSVETLPLKSDKIIIPVATWVVRKGFAPAVRIHGKQGYNRKNFKDFNEC